MRVNGTQYALDVDSRTSLLDLLRERLGLTGSKKGCDHGQCGACTVLIDGRRAVSCLALAVAQDGTEVTTVEGLAGGGKLHPLQAAFIEHDAFQCGYCTPGQLCSAAGMLGEPGPSVVTEDLACDPALSAAVHAAAGVRRLARAYLGAQGNRSAAVEGGVIGGVINDPLR